MGKAKPKQIGGNICIIGDRRTGKTTMIAGLAYKQSKHYTLTAISDDARTITNEAELIIMSRSETEATFAKVRTVDEIRNYEFLLEIKQRWKKPEKVSVNIRDYPGEVFGKLGEIGSESEEIFEDFIEASLRDDVAGCVVLVSEWEPGGNHDHFHIRAFRRFIQEMDKRGRLNNFRVAVAMSKCERGELWPGRIDPEYDLFCRFLPKTQELLRQRLPKNNLNFFALSTFGVLGNKDPRPNRTTISSRGAVLRKDGERVWEPYGVLSPMYWVSTGRRLADGL